MDALHTYFDGERQAGLCAALLGLISCAFATWLWSTTSTFRAMLVPLGLVGLIQLGVGVGLWVKTPGQVAALQSALGPSQPAAAAHTARSTEIVRMERVMKNFLVIKAVELVLIAVGVGLIFGMRQRGWVVGVGMGLLVQGAVMLAFDVFAEARGEPYLAWLRSGS